jgi:flagellar basal body rod protein FlgG
MITGMYKSAWGATAAQIRHEIVANNMANVNTVAFRPDWAVLRSYKTRAEVLDLASRPDARVLWSVGGGAMVNRSLTAHKSGPVHATGNSTDLAILGDRGFFEVVRTDRVTGERYTRYTRAGNFQVNSQGQLVTADGSWVVQSEAGGPIQVDNPDFLVDGDGRVRRLTPEGEEILGQVALRDFQDLRALNKTGENLFAAGPGAIELPARPDSRIEQFAIEMSGTNAAQTMVNMIEAMRSYEANINFVRMQDQLLGRAVTEIARLGG